MAAVAAAAIETRDLTKRYGRLTALTGLSIRIEENEVFGFLGPTGVGKTSTMRVLLGVLQPSGGGATVLGYSVTSRDVSWRQQIGYLPGELSLWPSFTGEETLKLLAGLTQRPPRWQAELL